MTAVCVSGDRYGIRAASWTALINIGIFAVAPEELEFTQVKRGPCRLYKNFYDFKLPSTRPAIPEPAGPAGQLALKQLRVLGVRRLQQFRGLVLEFSFDLHNWSVNV
jgi:hypothetical protein